MELIRFISENYLSFSIVQSSSFKSLVTKLNKNAKHHDRHTIRKKTVEMAAILKQKIKLLLKNKFVSITCDKWTSNVNQSYLGVTAHIIDDDWKMKSFVLTCSPTNSSIGSTAEELYTDITEVFTDYELDNSNISAIVTDTEPTMRKFGRLVTERNGVRWLGCISHLLELCTKTLATVDSDRDVDDDDNENKTVKTCLKQCRRLVGKFKHSAKLTQRLLSLQNKQNPLVLKECVSTRWWSTYTMLERIIALENSLKYLENENEIDCNLSNEQYAMIKGICASLQPFMSVQELLEGELYVTLSFVPTMISTIRKRMREAVQLASTDCKLAVTTVFYRFLADWGEKVDLSQENATGVHYLHLFGAFLDPRFKQLRSCNPSQQKYIYKLLIAEQNKLVVDDVVPLTIVNARNESFFKDDVAEEDEEVEIDERASSVSSTSDNTLRSEISSYLLEKDLDVKANDGSNNNPLDWWKVKNQQYPQLAKLAKKFLCIPASSAPSERLFSKAGITISNRRNRLHPGTAESLLFLSENFTIVDDVE